MRRLEHLGSGAAYSAFPLTNPPIDWTSPNWATYSIPLLEEEEGLWAEDVDETVSTTWLVFEGTTLPASMAAYKAVWTVPNNEDLQSQLEIIQSAVAALTSPIVYSPSYSGMYFTSQAEMEREFSVTGVSNRVDDYSGGDVTTLMNEIIIQATSEVKAILNSIFDDEDLVTNVWVRRRATLIGCYFLSIRRGNPSEYYNQYLDAMADLQDARDGKVFLDIAISGQRALMVNVSTDNRYPFQPIRVDTVSSTSGTEGINFVRYYIPYSFM